MSDEPAPDLAMARAVEILARLAEQQRTQPQPAAVALDRAAVLANRRLTLTLGMAREDVERCFGVGFAYPIRGWHSYAANEGGHRRLLSMFYAAGALVALEYYLPKRDGAPGLIARDYGAFRLEPGEVAIGAPTSALDARYAALAGGAPGVAFAETFHARFASGVAYVMGNGGRVERIGLYAAT